MENGENVAGSWSLEEEVNLLDAMVACGQDWISISKRCAGRSPDECERHYYNYFIDNPRLIDLSNLLTKTREEASYNCRKFLCSSLLSGSVCGCRDNKCDNSSSLSRIKEENSLSYTVGLERTFDSVETSETLLNNGVLEAYSNEQEQWGDSLSECDGISNFHPVDVHCLDSTNELYENRNSLNLKRIKLDVSFGWESTVTPEVSDVNHCRTSSSSKDSCRLNHLDSTYSSDDKTCNNLRRGSVGDLTEGCSSDKTQKKAEVFEPSYDDNELPSNSTNFPQELSAENVEFYGTRAGFDANRTEFDIEFDNGAEETLNMLSYELLQEAPNDDEDDDKNLVTELSISVVKGYLHRLKERHRRKSLVQRFGLLDYSKIANYMKTVETTFGKRFAKRLVLLKRLFSSKEYDDFMKGYQRLNLLKNNLSTLCNYRERGITTLAAGNLYEEMSKMRNESNKQIQAIPVIRRLENGESVLGNTFRRPAPPIAVHEMPGYESLEKEEADFCSVQRIAPKSFLEYKNTLINECKKRKCLKLAHARPLIKIDVNKTRKLYDLLLNKNLIWKDEKMTDQ